jgi:Inosine-uridine nucleoside N-ribohydrolase
MKRLYSILITLLLLGSTSFAQNKAAIFSKETVQPRMRIIIDNDFAGDPDGLFQLVHQILSPSVEIRAIIGSHLKPGDPFDSSKETATHAAQKVQDALKVMNLQGAFPVYEGSNAGLVSTDKPQVTEAAKAIVAEAMRTDVKTPLYVVCGAGLTDLASAYLMEPKIAEKLTLVWIGGSEYPGGIVSPNHTELEYNLGIDLPAGQVIFNKSNIPVWQVPRSTYRQALFSYAELLTKVKPLGETGKYLTEALEKIMKLTVQINYHIGETYILGDSPLVLLTALQSSFEADPSSCDYSVLKTPLINNKGLYDVNPNGRPIRVYNKIDTRLMFEDLIAKLQLFNL